MTSSNGYVIDIERATIENEYFRRVLYTTDKTQLVLMTLQPGEDIGMEVHESIDQFIRVEAGRGLAVLDDEQFSLEDGVSVSVPAGTYHDIINTSTTELLKLYTIYSPPEHPFNRVDVTKPLHD